MSGHHGREIALPMPNGLAVLGAGLFLLDHLRDRAARRRHSHAASRRPAAEETKPERDKDWQIESTITVKGKRGRKENEKRKKESANICSPCGWHYHRLIAFPRTAKAQRSYRPKTTYGPALALFCPPPPPYCSHVDYQTRKCFQKAKLPSFVSSSSFSILQLCSLSVPTFLLSSLFQTQTDRYALLSSSPSPSDACPPPCSASLKSTPVRPQPGLVSDLQTLLFMQHVSVRGPAHDHHRLSRPSAHSLFPLGLVLLIPPFSFSVPLSSTFFLFGPVCLRPELQTSPS